MRHNALMDWLIVLFSGLTIGLALVGAAVGWVWWQDGVVTIYAIETPLFILAGILLFVGGGMLRPAHTIERLNGPGIVDLMKREEDWRARKNLGVILVAGAVWGLGLAFLLDWIRR